MRHPSVVQGMEKFVRERFEAAGKPLPKEEAAWARLLALLDGFDSLPAEGRRERARAALEIIDEAAKTDGPRSRVPASQAAQAAEVAQVAQVAQVERPEGDRPAAGAASKPAAGTRVTAESPVQYVKGIGPRRAELFGRIGVETVADLLALFPRRYEDRGRLKPIRDLRPGRFETVAGEVLTKGVTITPRKKMKLFEMILFDGRDYLTAVWFNQAYLDKVFKPGQKVILGGVVQPRPGHAGFQMENPEYDVLEPGEPDESIHTGRIVPIYRETAGLTSRQIRTILDGLIESVPFEVPEILPASVRGEFRLPPPFAAVRDLHFPPEGTDFEALARCDTPAHRRFIVEELLLLEIGLARRKRAVADERKGISFKADGRLTGVLRASLPFALTQAQERVIGEISADMTSPHPMNRLLQGDVGSGKTVVALHAMLTAVESGWQAALMVPTEILADQHARNLRRLLAPVDVPLALLRSGMKKKEREAVLEGLAGGAIPIAVGTHALIQDEVAFRALGLVVVDEQHRFGVIQRATLQKKGWSPDVLVMTATPIPRTLAMTAYGDLDVSVIDGKPPGRKPVRTLLLYESQRRRLEEAVRRELAAGRQAYVICPLVEESEKSDLKAAVQTADRLSRSVFPEYKVGLVHGRMSSAEKDAVMSDFAAGRVRVLVATTVIEVGVDVPNASVMVLEHAERFGLAQMHQLRGRIGRGEHGGVCYLLAPPHLSEEARARLSAMVRTDDGFVLAEEDLVLRGPGEILGTRQSGIPELRAANLMRDAKLIERIRTIAFEIVARDPGLSEAEHRPLASALAKRWSALDLSRIG
ncbi:MAG: ATP-dependent DNA helicase RecG [Nitrospirae bacterium]|nr:ATP-dependent DNA helicase RecG [Nitrospirota bacterium]